MDLATRGSRPYVNLLLKVSTPARLFEKNKPLGYPNQISFEYLGLGSFKKSTGVVYQHIMKRLRSTSRPRPGVCT